MKLDLKNILTTAAVAAATYYALKAAGINGRAFIVEEDLGGFRSGNGSRAQSFIVEEDVGGFRSRKLVNNVDRPVYKRIASTSPMVLKSVKIVEEDLNGFSQTLPGTAFSLGRFSGAV